MSRKSYVEGSWASVRHEGADNPRASCHSCTVWIWVTGFYIGLFDAFGSILDISVYLTKVWLRDMRHGRHWNHVFALFTGVNFLQWQNLFG